MYYQKVGQIIGRSNIVSSNLLLSALISLLFVQFIHAPNVEAQTVSCFSGESTTQNRYFVIDTDAKTCITSTSPIPYPQNGVGVILVTETTHIQFIANRLENGIIIGGPNGNEWSNPNYNGQNSYSANSTSYLGTLVSNNVSVTFTINGTNNYFSVSSINKTDGVDSLIYGNVSINFPIAPIGPNAVDKSKIADYLLSGFLKSDQGIFGPSGVPVDIGGKNSVSIDPNNGVSILLHSKSITSSSLAGFRKSPTQMNLARSDDDNIHPGEHSVYINQGDNSHNSPWNFWTGINYLNLEDNTENFDRSGYLWSFTGGVSYSLNSSTTIGGFTRLRNGVVNSSSLNANLKGQFVGGGIFLSSTLDNGLRLMAAGSYESGKSDILVNGDVGRFNSLQRSLDIRVDKRFEYNSFWLEPALALQYSSLFRDSYRDSTNTQISASKTNLGRITFGPVLGNTLVQSNSILKPYIHFKSIWDFDVSNQFQLTSGKYVSQPVFGFNLGGGVQITFDNEIVFNTSVDWSRYSDDFYGISFSGDLSIPLTYIDKSLPGKISMNISRIGEDITAKALISVPLGQ